MNSEQIRAMEPYGFGPFFQSQLDLARDAGLYPARVTEVHRERCLLVGPEGERPARPRGSLLHRAAGAADLPSVGDFVLARANPGGEDSVVRLLARKTKFSRPDYGGHAAAYVKTISEQVVAANFDVVLILSSLNRDFNLKKLERYTAAALRSGAEPVILLTKADLAPESEREARSEETRAACPGVRVGVVSAHTGEGMEAVAALAAPGSTLVFLGSSGVGKSSLVNALAGEERMAVSAIREEDARGRHTTTHRELIRLAGGALVIDTPGMRELGMWESADGVRAAFADVEALARACRYSDCAHGREDGCAVKRALADGTLDPGRYEYYRSLLAENSFTAVRSDARKNRDRGGKREAVEYRRKKSEERGAFKE